MSIEKRIQLARGPCADPQKAHPDTFAEADAGDNTGGEMPEAWALAIQGIDEMAPRACRRRWRGRAHARSPIIAWRVWRG